MSPLAPFGWVDVPNPASPPSGALAIDATNLELNRSQIAAYGEAFASTAADAAQAASIPTAQKGAANGIATLDSASRLPTGQLPVGVGQWTPVDLGNISGNITLNNPAEKVFHGSLTGDADLHLISGATSGVIAGCQIRIKTNGHKLTYSMVDEWLQGIEPPAEAIATTDFYTEDGGTTIYGIGVAAIPAEYARLGVIADGQVGLYNATTGKLDGTALAPGLTKSAAEVLVAEALANAVLNNGSPLRIVGSYAPGQILQAIAEGEAQFFPVVTSVGPFVTLRPKYVITNKSEILGTNTITLVTKSATTQTLPTSFIGADDERVTVINTSTGPIKVEGKIEGAALVTVELEPGEVRTFSARLTGEPLGSTQEWFMPSGRAQAGASKGPNINTTSKTSSQITKAYEAAFKPEKPPVEGSIAWDGTNHLDLRYSAALAKWFKSAALSEIA